MKSLPVWYIISVIIYAAAVIPVSWKNAHFHELLSRFTMAKVAIQGALNKANTIMEKAINGE